MSVVLITGSAGLVGSEAAQFFSEKNFDIVGIDNDMRKYFFGSDASTEWNKKRLIKQLKNYHHENIDIRNEKRIESIFKKYRKDLKLIVHSAAQPSHDWAAKEPLTDFSINAVGTLNLLEMTHRYAPEAVFIFMSTNKVYGDSPNTLPFVELETRWEIAKDHPFYSGINETMSIDQSQHSLFGASKASADLMVQEYGRAFGLKTACFRAGCLSGPNHSGAMLHGFLSYLMKCCVTGNTYSILGYKGKQVRDNIHSCDLVNAFYQFFLSPRVCEVYNIGGSRANSCSIKEAIGLCENISGKKMQVIYKDQNRIGDHIWYISDNNKFKSHYPSWNQRYTLKSILEEIHGNSSRWL